jgi:hypothetical protein
MKQVIRWKFEADFDPDTHGRVYAVLEDESTQFRGFYSINPHDPNEAWVRLEGAEKAQIVRFG